MEVSQSTVIEGDDIDFLCEAFSNPAPRLQLQKQISGGGASVLISKTTTQLAVVVQLTRSDNGAEYFCRVDNERQIGEWQLEKISARQKITVLCEFCFIFLYLDILSAKLTACN